LLDTQIENKSDIPHATTTAAAAAAERTSFLNIGLSSHVDSWEVKCPLAA